MTLRFFFKKKVDANKKVFDQLMFDVYLANAG